MARAAALSAIGDLPPEMLRLADAVLAEYTDHLARDRELCGLAEGLRDYGRRWPELA